MSRQENYALHWVQINAKDNTDLQATQWKERIVTSTAANLQPYGDVNGVMGKNEQPGVRFVY